MSKRIREIAELLRQYHADRDPVRLQMKLRLMRRDPFSFFRGTSIVFWSDWPAKHALNSAPAAWSTGDLHAENFGSFRGNNRLTYFDLNDFDEAVLAPCTFDLVRLWTSLHVATRALELSVTDADMGRALLNGYREALRFGKPLWIERATAVGAVRSLLTQVRERSPDALIRARCKMGATRRIRLDGIHAYAAPRAEQRQVSDLLLRWFSDAGLHGNVRILDVARRIAGNGSLGVERYIILARGVMAADAYTLLDLKRESVATALRATRMKQPAWKSEAQRVVTVQTMMQAVSPALFTEGRVRGRSYVLRELMPSQDRVRLQSLRRDPRKLLLLVHNFGQVLAWGQLRASGRQGAAAADDLIAFARDRAWVAAARAYASRYAKVVYRDWQEFRSATHAVKPAVK